MNDSKTMVERIISDGEQVALADAGKCVGEMRNGPAVHPCTMGRWALWGVRSATGRRVYLDHARLGGKTVTTRAALVRFFAEQSERPNDVPIPRTPTERQRAAERATAELEAMGV
jgi:hypothetical protein